MASFRCSDNSDVNFHLYLFFQIFVNGDVVYDRTWEVLRADVGKYQPELYKSEKSQILKKIP